MSNVAPTALAIGVLLVLIFAWLDQDRPGASCPWCGGEYGKEVWADEDFFNFFCSSECLNEWEDYHHRSSHLGIFRK